ncbi:hypothetical protein HOY80DRAFT_1051036 [Tuber brumale]|nr:hypothetical protein HOY80DRAFT_1051036 [Tuber brumale]
MDSATDTHKGKSLVALDDIPTVPGIRPFQDADSNTTLSTIVFLPQGPQSLKPPRSNTITVLPHIDEQKKIDPQTAPQHAVVLIEMIYLIHEDYKAKIDKLAEVVDFLKLEIDELKATAYPDTPTPIPFNPTKAKALESSTGPTTYPPQATSSLSNATPS